MGVKKLKLRDKLLLTLALFGDLGEELRDPGGAVSASYKNLYGFVPKNYKRTNYRMLVQRMTTAHQIEKTIKNGEVYIVLKNRKGVINNFFPFTRLQENWDNKLRIVIFDIGEVNRKRRDLLRKKLIELGFGMWQKSVWITPLGIEDDFREFLETQALKNFVFIFTIDSKEIGNVKAFAEQVWKISRSNEAYSNWIEEVKNVKKGTEEFYDLQERFWKILIRDPGLPHVFLPSFWKGKEAMGFFKKFYITKTIDKYT